MAKKTGYEYLDRLNEQFDAAGKPSGAPRQPAGKSRQGGGLGTIILIAVVAIVVLKVLGVF